MTLPWLELSLFMVAVLLLALYGLTVSGHFPFEARAAALRSGAGRAILWTTIGAACLAALIVLGVATGLLSGTSIIIGGGAMLLLAPLALRPFPDVFVNGPSGLITFAAGALAAAIVLWIAK